MMFHDSKKTSPDASVLLPEGNVGAGLGMANEEHPDATARFPLDKKLPVGLVRMLIKARKKKNGTRRTWAKHNPQLTWPDYVPR